MFYRIKDDRVYDYADYQYAEDCLFSALCTMSEFQKNPEIYSISGGTLGYVENYQEVILQKTKEKFEHEFFETSLGWIRRKVSMKDGSVKDFLADLLLPIKAGMELGQNVEIITYKTPDFSKDLDSEYMKTLQELKYANPQFIQECLFQTVKDFRGDVISDNYGVNTGVNPENMQVNTEAEGGSNGV